jgi:hypothetical protein
MLTEKNIEKLKARRDALMYKFAEYMVKVETGTLKVNLKNVKRS